MRVPKRSSADPLAPLGRPRIDAALDASIRKALHKGDLGIRKIAVKLGVATGTVQRVRAEMAVPAQRASARGGRTSRTMSRTEMAEAAMSKTCSLGICPSAALPPKIFR